MNLQENRRLKFGEASRLCRDFRELRGGTDKRQACPWFGRYVDAGWRGQATSLSVVRQVRRCGVARTSDKLVRGSAGTRLRSYTGNNLGGQESLSVCHLLLVTCDSLLVTRHSLLYQPRDNPVIHLIHFYKGIGRIQNPYKILS